MTEFKEGDLVFIPGKIVGVIRLDLTCVEYQVEYTSNMGDLRTRTLEPFLGDMLVPRPSHGEVERLKAEVAELENREELATCEDCGGRKGILDQQCTCCLEVGIHD